MEKSSESRRYRRYVVEGIHGNVLYTSDIEILNISIDGAAIETPKRLELNREYTFKIHFSGGVLDLKGRVVWAILISKEIKGSSTPVPLYRVGVKFSDTLSEKAQILIKFIEENQDRTIEKRLGGVRFKLSANEKVKIDYPQKYLVKKISQAGMLAETEYPLDEGSRYDIELFINEHAVQIIGKISNCEKFDSGGVSKYNIGVEFVEFSDEDKALIKGFLESLEA